MTQAVIGAAIEVHKHMGPGLLESVHQACLECELRLRGVEFQSQVKLPLIYKGQKLDDYFVLDFYFPSKLVVELKAVEKVLGVHEAQLLTNMKLSKCPVGLLLNFNVPVLKDGMKRFVL
ncbi:MAG: GxxExxY protein [Gemmataceae bacterium]|nr:GxxExxY protein [Gemmataceae bacterium]